MKYDDFVKKYVYDEDFKPKCIKSYIKHDFNFLTNFLKQKYCGKNGWIIYELSKFATNKDKEEYVKYFSEVFGLEALCFSQ